MAAVCNMRTESANFIFSTHLSPPDYCILGVTIIGILTQVSKIRLIRRFKCGGKYLFAPKQANFLVVTLSQIYILSDMVHLFSCHWFWFICVDAQMNPLSIF